MEVSNFVLLFHSENSTFQHWDSGKLHLLSDWGNCGVSMFFWCLLPNSAVPWLMRVDITTSEKAGNLHLLKAVFHCVILAIWIQHPYLLSFFFPFFFLKYLFSLIPRKPGFTLLLDSSWQKSSVVFFQLIKLFPSKSFGFGTDHSSQILLCLSSIIYNLSLK